MKYISIGMQCTVATVFEQLDIKEETLPFDWMLSSPVFVAKILYLLLIDNKDIGEIVKTYYFDITSFASMRIQEHYFEDIFGKFLYNKIQGVVFPHDKIDDTEKFIRRFERLKKIILNTDEDITFVYISPSSGENGNYTLDGNDAIIDVYKSINNIFDTIQTVRNTKFKFVIYDTLNLETVTNLYKEITHIRINPQSNWRDLLEEIKAKFVY